MEVNKFDYALDYQIAICFEIEDIALSKEEVLQLVEERFQSMNIKLGTSLGSKPIAVLCAHNFQYMEWDHQSPFTNSPKRWRGFVNWGASFHPKIG